jgi:hypothetical protein
VSLPIPRCPLNVREATIADLPFIDALQKRHNKMVGWMPTKTLEGKIKLKQVIVAEETPDQSSHPEPGAAGRPVGYAIGADRYFKRDDVGIIYQMNVAPQKHRSLVGATLVQGMFDRAHVSCKLFCLWCAQDIEANWFWESLGFVPIAFRAGSRAKDRVHIFWEKRVRAGDTSTPWWYPTQTSGGSIREDRLVFPIPPGVKWSDPMPRVLPAMEIHRQGAPELESPEQVARRQIAGPTFCGKNKPPRIRRPGAFSLSRSKFYFSTAEPAKLIKQKQERQKLSNDPRLLAMARELNSRWLEEINNNPLALPAPGG